MWDRPANRASILPKSQRTAGWLRGPAPSRRRGLLPIAAAGTAVLAVVAGTPAASASIRAGIRTLAPSAPAAAAAAKPSSMIAASGTIAVKRAGVTWRLGVHVSWIPTETIVTAYLLRVAHHVSEVHYWSVTALPARAVTFQRSGSWTVAPRPGAIAPLFPAFRLTFTASAHRNASNCAKGSQTSYTGSMSGSMELASGLSSVGMAGSKKISFGRASHATIDRSCVVTKTPCAATSVNWFEGAVPFAQTAEGLTEKSTDTIQLDATTNLARPAHATRRDSLWTAEPAAITRGQALIVRTRAGTAIKGKAKLTKTGRLPVTHLACWRRGVRHTQVTTSWLASFTATPLTAKTVLTGTLSTPRATGSANITKIVIK
jgi:hypothetical protein